MNITANHALRALDMPNETLSLIATRHTLHLERLKSSEVKKFDSFLVEMDADIRTILTKSNPTTTKKLNEQLKLIGSKLHGTYDDYQKVWDDSIKSTSIYEADFEKRSLENVLDGVSFTLPSDSAISAAVHASPLGDVGKKYGGELLKGAYEAFSDAEVKNIQSIIRLGFAEGQTTAQIITRLRGTKAANWTDGALAITKREAELITRTSLQHAANQARGEVWNDNKSVIDKIKILATLDQKTSSICRSYDSMEFPIDKGPRPPFHIRCRTTTVAVVKDKYKFLNKGSQRRAKGADGESVLIDADNTYYDWLKKQPVDFQDSVIGKTRGQLLRNGGISSERFAELQMSKNFKALNLEQMRKLDVLAFEKAEIVLLN